MKKQSILWSLLLIGISQTLSFGQSDSLGDGPPCPPYCGFESYTFRTKGNKLFDPCGSPVVLKGVNKMAVFDYTDPFGIRYFREIAATGANCVRIAWEMKSNVNSQPNPLSRLDSLITNAKKNQLIPIVGLWDYTGDDDGGFAKLGDYVTYWTNPAMIALIRKHQKALIINIGNEAARSVDQGGNEENTSDLDTFATHYRYAVQRMRLAGILVPLMIDGMDRGKSLQCFIARGPDLLRADPRRNLIFSFHAYWSKSDTDSMDGGQFIRKKFDAVQRMPNPVTIIIGEVSKYGAYPGDTLTSPCSAAGVVDYKQFVQRAEAIGMGWLLWEWGPGNQWKVAGDCPQMDMTTNGTIATLGTAPDNGWAKELATTASYSIQRTAQRTFFITHKFTTCPNNN